MCILTGCQQKWQADQPVTQRKYVADVDILFLLEKVVPSAEQLSPFLSLRWLRRNAQRSERSCQNGEGSPVESPIQVYGDRDLFMLKLSRPNQPVYIDMVQERSKIF